MKTLAPIFCLLYLFFGTITAQLDGITLPKCASACRAASFPECTDFANQSCTFCTDSALQPDFKTCVMTSCTIKEALTTTNVTATTCNWPRRDESLLLRNASLPLFVIATICMIARIIARLPSFRGKSGPDDYIIFVAWVLLCVLTKLLCLMGDAGLGKDIWTLPFDNVTLTLKIFANLTYFYILVCWLTKVSILLLFLRLFPDHTFRLVTKIGVAFCSLAGFTFFWACLLQCAPISLIWTFWDGEHTGKCPNWAAQGWAHVSVNIFADTAILLLPLPKIWKLNLPLEKKLGVMAMFSVGLFVTLVSTYRATRLPRIAHSTNFTWNLTEPSLWSVIEIHVSVMCACMPGIRAFSTQVLRVSDWKKTKEGHERVHSGQPTDSNKSIGSGGGALQKSKEKDPFGLDTVDLESESKSKLGSEEV